MANSNIRPAITMRAIHPRKYQWTLTCRSPRAAAIALRVPGRTSRARISTEGSGSRLSLKLNASDFVHFRHLPNFLQHVFRRAAIHLHYSDGLPFAGFITAAQREIGDVDIMLSQN